MMTLTSNLPQKERALHLWLSWIPDGMIYNDFLIVSFNDFASPAATADLTLMTNQDALALSPDSMSCRQKSPKHCLNFFRVSAGKNAERLFSR